MKIKPVFKIKWDWNCWYETINDRKVYYPLAISYRTHIKESQYKAYGINLTFLFVNITLAIMKLKDESND